jgi:hypothetical protein
MEILKICKVHGPLTLKDCVKKGSLDKVSYRCNICYKEIKKKYYENNKEKVLKKNAEYRKKDPSKTIGQKIDSRLTNPYHRKKYIEKDYEYFLHSRKNLTDMYVRKLICRRSGLRSKDIPQNLVDLVRDARIFKEKITEIRKVERIDNYHEEMGLI